MKLKNPKHEAHSALELSGRGRRAQHEAEELFWKEQKSLDQESRARFADSVVQDPFSEHDLGQEIASSIRTDARVVGHVYDLGLHVFDPEAEVADELLRVSEHLPRGFVLDDPAIWIDQD